MFFKNSCLDLMIKYALGHHENELLSILEASDQESHYPVFMQ